MREIKTCGAQGDVLVRRVEKIPAGFSETTRQNGEPIVLSHSETGHHHLIDAVDVKVFEDKMNPLICYLQMGNEPCDITHMRSYDTHETLRLLGGAGTIWEARRQREYVPEGWRRVQD